MSTQKGDEVRQKHKRAEKVGAYPCKSVKVLDKTCASVREVRVEKVGSKTCASVEGCG